eukprot:1156083-Pelagomonas_calceolata.AAC.2
MKTKHTPTGWNWSKLYTGHAPPSPPKATKAAESHDSSAFSNQNNNKLPYFLHESIAFYEQASSRTSRLKALSL